MQQQQGRRERRGRGEDATTNSVTKRCALLPAHIVPLAAGRTRKHIVKQPCHRDHDGVAGDAAIVTETFEISPIERSTIERGSDRATLWPPWLRRRRDGRAA